MGGGVSVQQVIQDGDKGLWRRVVSVEEHEKYQSKYLAYTSKKTKREAYKATKAELMDNWSRGYSDSAAKVLERWGACIVKKLLLVRTFQCSSYSGDSNSDCTEFSEKLMTADNCERLARSRKRDQLFTTALWFQLDERFWVSVEKKEVIHMCS